MGFKNVKKILKVVLFSIRLIIRKYKGVDHKAGTESEMAKHIYFCSLLLFGQSRPVSGDENEQICSSMVQLSVGPDTFAPLLVFL